MSAAVIERTGPVLTTRRAAEYCGIAVQTLYNLISEGAGPKTFKQGRLNAFYASDLDAWLSTRITDPASSPSGVDAALPDPELPGGAALFHARGGDA